jgi:hypothetical protein
MNWLDALDIADGFLEDPAELDQLLNCSVNSPLVEPYTDCLGMLGGSSSDSETSMMELETTSADSWTLPTLGELQTSESPKARVHWTASEDELLKRLAKRLRPDWSKVADHFPNHSVASVQKRWHRKFDPSVKKSRWSSAEDTLIVSLFEVEGGNWTKIAKSLPGRYAESTKNRFYGTIRKRLSADLHQRLALRVRSGNIDALRSFVSPAKCADLSVEVTKENLSKSSIVCPSTSFSSLDRTEKKQKILELRERMKSLEVFLSSTKEQIMKIEKDLE